MVCFLTHHALKHLLVIAWEWAESVLENLLAILVSVSGDDAYVGGGAVTPTSQPISACL